MYEGPRSLSRAQVPMSGGPRPYVSGPQGLCLRAPGPYVYGAQMGMYGNSTLHLYGSILCEILHQMKMMSGATWVRSKPTRGVGLEFWEQIPAHQRWRSGVTRCRSQPTRYVTIWKPYTKSLRENDAKTSRPPFPIWIRVSKYEFKY